MMTRSRSWEAASADPAKPIPKTPPANRPQKRRSSKVNDATSQDREGQWRALWAWWAVHAVSNGLGRVAFDVYLPFSPDATPAHIAHLLAVGTVATIAGKLASGPICAYLGARWIGLATLLVNAILFAAAYAGTEVAPFLWVFAASRFSQCFTWVCIPQILSEWFSKSRHGECFGYMSTASRTGIISTTALLYLAGADVASRNHFAVGAAVMLACFAFFSAVFPTSRGAGAPNSNSDSRCSSADAVAAPVSPSMPPTTEATTTSTSTESFYAIVKSAAANPIILMQFPVMMSATPLAEFQSQVPVMLKGDPALAPELVSFGTMLWHVGVLSAVLFCGKRLDRLSMLGRLMLIGIPTALAALAFFLASAYGMTGDGSPFVGSWKLPLILFLGAACAPPQYLVVGPAVSRHVGSGGQATIMSIIDMSGYLGTMLLFRAAVALGDDNSVPAANGVSVGILRASTLSAAICATAVTVVFLLENRAQVAARKTV